MRGPWIVVPILLLSLACTRALDPLPGLGDGSVSFAFDGIAVEGLAGTKSGGAVVQELVSEDGMSAFVLAEEMGPMAGISTRGAAVNAVSAITSFRVTAYDHSGSFGASTITRSGGKGFTDETFTVAHSGSDYWGAPSSTKYWPTSDRYLSFFACAPYDAASIGQTAGFPSFDYTVSDDIASQKDLLVASKLDQVHTVTSQGTVGRAPLTFRHILSAVVFSIGDMGVNSNSGSLTVTLSGLKNCGKFIYSTNSSASSNGGTWDNRKGSGTYSFTTNLHGTNSSPVDYSTMSSGSNVLFLMPQSISEDATITIRYTDPAGAAHQFSAQLTTLGISTFSPGSLYKYTVSLSNKPAALTVKYLPWNVSGESGTVYGPISQYTTSDKFGVYAVDANNRVVLANAPMTAASASANPSLNSGNYFLSSEYTYYIYYPYKSDLALTYQGTAVTAGAVLPGTARPSDAYVFFNDYWTRFIPAVDQSTLASYKASDLQVGASTGSTGTITVNMHHQMSLGRIVLKTAQVWENGFVTTGSKVATSPNPFSTDASNAVPYRNGSTDDYYYIAKYDTKPWVSDNKANEYARWTTTPVIIQNASSAALGSSNYRSFIVQSRAESRGWRTYVGNFDYTGDAQTFKTPIAGVYKFECWGAQGHSTNYGKGAYTVGYLNRAANATFYVYVGQKGRSVSASPATGWNGGGNLGGGGATDIRTRDGAWNNATSLGSRIMVAAGGGGDSHHGYGGYGGAPNGRNGIPDNTLTGSDSSGKGASLSRGGLAGSPHTWGNPAPTDGELGQGGQGNTYGGGGGGGYYGGGGAGISSQGMAGGGGGSSFISGLNTNYVPAISGYVFDHASMISGGATQTDQNGTSGTGHAGNGYARITFMEPI